MSKKNKIIIIFIALSLISVSIFLLTKINRNNDAFVYPTPSEWSNSQKKTLILKDPIDAKSVIFENERVIITFGAEDFKRSLWGFIKQYPGGDQYDFIREDYELIAYIEEKSIGNEFIFISNAEKNMQTRAKFRVADLLENGTCKIFDKKEKNYLKEINIEKWSNYGGFGRNYIIPTDNFIFFDVLDGMS
jgi:hypothetical protein